jgi:hypothetical protein
MENKDELNNFFDPKQYITTIVGSESDTFNIDEDKISILISLLTDPQNKDAKEEALISLKKEKAGELLLAAIAKIKEQDKKYLLVAACWESEINFSKYLSFFILLALDPDYLVSLEAITVIQNMEGPFDEKIVKSEIQKIKKEQKNALNERLVLLNDLLFTLQGFITK